MGVNHVENANLPHGPGSCPNGTFGPQWQTAESGAFCAWFMLTYDRSLNRSAYHDATLALYNSTAAWAANTGRRLQQWNVNTVGSWSSEELTSPSGAAPLSSLTYGLSLDMLMTSYEHRMLPSGGMPRDVFSPAFAARCADIAARQVRPRRNDPRLLGYWTDNESIWASSGKVQLRRGAAANTECHFSSLLDAALLTFAADSAGLAATLEFLQQRYNGSLGALAAAWGLSPVPASWAGLPSACPFPTGRAAHAADALAYLTFYADAYMQVVEKAVRAEDSVHMLLGPRMNDVGEIGEAVLRGTAPHTAVIDLHMYAALPDTQRLAELHAATGRPVLMSEFGMVADDSGLPNGARSHPPRLPTQTARGAALAAYVQALVRLPFVVGYHLFAWADEAAAGNLFGANDNWGLVHLSEDPYAAYAAALAAVNQAAPAWHAEG